MEFYNYPSPKHVSPFEAKNADNYFAEAGKITYPGTFEEIGNIATPFDERNNIFTGAYVLCIYKRYAVIENGVITYRNQNFNDEHEIGASRYKTKNFILFVCISPRYLLIYSKR